MSAIVIFLAMSLDVGGVGGLLSGIFARSFQRAMLWAAGFGVLNVIMLVVVSPTARFVPILLLIALFWGLVGWLGRFIALRLTVKAVAK